MKFPSAFVGLALLFRCMAVSGHAQASDLSGPPVATVRKTSVSADNADPQTNSPSKALELHSDTVVGYPLSDSFRRNVVTVPDEIETLRAAMKERAAIRGVRFDEIASQLESSRRFVETPADLDVYYALFHANHLLALSFYRRLANASEASIAEGQLESVTCSLESKFALLRGVLYAGIQNCSILSHIKPAGSASGQLNHRGDATLVSDPLQPLVALEPSASPNVFRSFSRGAVDPASNSSDDKVVAASTPSTANHQPGIKNSIEAVVHHTVRIVSGGSEAGSH